MQRLRNIIPALIIVCGAALLHSCANNKTRTPPASYFVRLVDSVTEKFNYSYSGFHFLDSLFALYPAADVESRFNFYGYGCAYYHKSKNDNAKAMAYADSLLMLVRDNADIKDYERLAAIANISKGDILFYIKEYNGAYQYYYLGKVAAEKSLDPCIYSEYSYRLGMVMYKKNRFADAAVFFKQSFAESAGCKEQFSKFYRRQELLNNTALSYKKSGLDDSALIYYDKALKYIGDKEKNYPDKNNFFQVAKGVVYGNTAQVYANSNAGKAEALYKQSIDINSKPGNDINDALLTQVHLARLYYEKHDMHDLLTTLESIKNGRDTIKNEDALTQWAEMMWKYYDDKKDIPNAYTWLTKYNNFKNAEDTDNKKLDETDVSGQMKDLEEEYQVNLLKKDNKLSRAYLLGTAILFVMAGIILWFILLNWRRSKKYIKELTYLNNRIKKQKGQLEDTLGELENRNKEKDRILGIVAHDLRNPIAAISSLIYILREEHEYNEEEQQVLELMQNACTNSIELINEILEIAVDDNAVEAAAVHPVDLNLIAGNCVKMLRFKAAEKNQTLQLSLSPTPEIIKANPAKIWRVISNLITNAVKFSPPGAAIQIATSHFGDAVQVVVKDRGIGIPDEIKTKIFDTHTDAKRAGTQGEKPFGIGLSICKQIVESCQGKIWFESAVGKGTDFYVTLPKVNVQDKMGG